LENVKREMQRYGISVLGLSEVRWKKEKEGEKEKGDFMSDDVSNLFGRERMSKRSCCAVGQRMGKESDSDRKKE